MSHLSEFLCFRDMCWPASVGQEPKFFSVTWIRHLVYFEVSVVLLCLSRQAWNEGIRLIWFYKSIQTAKDPISYSSWRCIWPNVTKCPFSIHTDMSIVCSVQKKNRLLPLSSKLKLSWETFPACRMTSTCPFLCGEGTEQADTDDHTRRACQLDPVTHLADITQGILGYF